jgi:hypothetical protein
VAEGVAEITVLDEFLTVVDDFVVELLAGIRFMVDETLAMRVVLNDCSWLELDAELVSSVVTVALLDENHFMVVVDGGEGVVKLNEVPVTYDVVVKVALYWSTGKVIAALEPPKRETSNTMIIIKKYVFNAMIVL